MKKKEILLKLPEGKFNLEVLIFEKGDMDKIRSIYKNWRTLCADLASIDARKVNLPEGLSETAICLEMGWYRVNNSKLSGNFNSSFDCYDPKANDRIQVKATSIEEDLTSFGPKSVWDRLCFLDFYKDGEWNGKYDYYDIDTKSIGNIILNQEKNETFQDQQRLGRRPRLSIKKQFIKEKNIRPVFTFNIF